MDPSFTVIFAVSLIAALRLFVAVLLPRHKAGAMSRLWMAIYFFGYLGGVMLFAMIGWSLSLRVIGLLALWGWAFAARPEIAEVRAMNNMIKAADSRFNREQKFEKQKIAAHKAALDGETYEGLIGKAEYHLHSEQIDQGLKCLFMAMRLRENDFMASYMLAGAYQRFELQSAARGEYQRALNLSEELPPEQRQIYRPLIREQLLKLQHYGGELGNGLD